MNIDMVSLTASPIDAATGRGDGPNAYVADLARALARAGHEVVVYARRDDPAAREEIELFPGVSVVHLTAGPARPLSKHELLPHLHEFGARLAARWQARRPDVVHAHYWLGGLAALSGAQGLDIPVVQTYHVLGSLKRGTGQPCPSTRLRMEKALARSAHAVIATSECERSELLRLGVGRHRVHTVPCGVDIERFTPRGPAFPRGETVRLVTLSRLDDRKGVSTAIEVLARVPGAELVVAGGPPREELDADADVHRLRQAAKEAGVADRVVFLGRIPRDDVPKLLRSADLTLALSRYEPFGMVPIESMACGVPVVASAVGGHLDTVIDDVTGLHVPTRRPVEVARRIRTLLADPTHLGALGVGGTDRAQSRYSWERIAAETLKVYERVAPVPALAVAS